MASTEPAIDVRELVVQHPSANQPAVNGISFSVPRGSVLALLGPNGAGKTTTVETLEGYKRPTSGTVRVLGMDPVASAKQLTPRIGVMLQRNGVYMSMGSAQVLSLFASYYKTARPVDQLLELVSLQNVAKTPWRRLSGGEQQRLSLAMALVGNPEVAFLDEPTAGMDPSARQILWGVIEQLRDEGATVLLTTHFLDEAERLADDVVIIDKGRIVAHGSPSSLRNSAANDIRFSAQPGLQLSDLSHRIGVPVAEISTGEYRVDTSPNPQTIAAITTWMAEHDVTIGDLRGGRQRLEDVFLQLTTELEDIASSGSRRQRRNRQ